MLLFAGSILRGESANVKLGAAMNCSVCRARPVLNAGAPKQSGAIGTSGLGSARVTSSKTARSTSGVAGPPPAASAIAWTG